MKISKKLLVGIAAALLLGGAISQIENKEEPNTNKELGKTDYDVKAKPTHYYPVRKSCPGCGMG